MAIIIAYPYGKAYLRTDVPHFLYCDGHGLSTHFHRRHRRPLPVDGRGVGAGWTHGVHPHQGPRPGGPDGRSLPRSRHRPGKLADARRLHVQVQDGQIPARHFSPDRDPGGARGCRAVLGAFPRPLCGPRRYGADQAVGPQHGAGSPALRAVPGAARSMGSRQRPSRDVRGAGLGAAGSSDRVVPGGGVEGHHRPACRAGRADRGQPRRRHRLSLGVLRAARPQEDDGAVARDRAALSRRSGGAGL